MKKIVFIGAGSFVFAKNLIGDCMLTPSLRDSEFALLDINHERLDLAEKMIQNLNHNINSGKAVVKAYKNQKEALRNADFVINAIQVGGYDECITKDFEIPMKYGLRQTYGDTLGIGGVFRGLRTIPVMQGIVKDMEEVCPDALLLNYSNPMCIVTGAVLKSSAVRTIGLCHSVQRCAGELLQAVGMQETDVTPEDVEYEIAGINHQAWLLKITKDGADLYPEIKRRASALNHSCRDAVRLEIMKRFGYYVTESSIHTAEYTPYFIKNNYPSLAAEFGLKTDMYLYWGEEHRGYWEQARKEIVENKNLTHKRTLEYASYIMNAVVTGTPVKINANCLNKGYITNLPENACVEIPCIVDGNGVHPCKVGELPLQCAALNRTNINVQDLTIRAALTGKKEHVYQALMLDPHTAAELSIDDIVAMCDEMLFENKKWLPMFDNL